MEFRQCPFTVVSFDKLPSHLLEGEEGSSTFCEENLAGARIRLVEYSPGYVADHWCELGHFGYMLSGNLVVELRGKTGFNLNAGQAFLVSTEGDAPHRVSTVAGARMLLLD